MNPFKGTTEPRLSMLQQTSGCLATRAMIPTTLMLLIIRSRKQNVISRLMFRTGNTACSKRVYTGLIEGRLQGSAVMRKLKRNKMSRHRHPRLHAMPTQPGKGLVKVTSSCGDEQASLVSLPQRWPPASALST